MPTLSYSPSVPGAQQQLNPIISPADSILQTDVPVNHPYAPDQIALGVCETPDSNTFDVFTVPVGTGQVNDFFVNLRTPRRLIFYRGNDGNGAKRAFITLVPLGKTFDFTAAANRGTILQNAIPFSTNAITVTSVADVLCVKFCKPVSKFFIQSQDTGQPGENLVFVATDDLDMF